VGGECNGLDCSNLRQWVEGKRPRVGSGQHTKSAIKQRITLLVARVLDQPDPHPQTGPGRVLLEVRHYSF